MTYRSNFDLSVYLVADPSLCAGRGIVDVVRAALEGGVCLVQYRDKGSAQAQMVDHARALKAVTADFNVPLLINDHVELALEIDADGVHLGQGDMRPEAARAALGADKIIGLTAFTRAHIDAIDPVVVDYIGTGPFFETQTDKGKPVLGAEKFTQLAALSPVPMVGIGGITPARAAAVIAAGADGVAMMRAISAADDPRSAAHSFVGNVKAAQHLRRVS